MNVLCAKANNAHHNLMNAAADGTTCVRNHSVPNDAMSI